MPTVVVAPSLVRWLTPAPTSDSGTRSYELPGATVREVVEALFSLHPQFRGYVTDERGALRHHVVVFVNGTAVCDKLTLSEVVAPNGEVHIFQALSGG